MNIGYIVVIILLSALASFSMVALWVLMGRLNEQEDRLIELDARVSTLQSELLAHSHSEHKTTPTIPNTYPIVRYTWERRRRVRWQ